VASVVNRETVRNSLAGMLSSALVGSGKPVQVVYSYKAAQLGGQTPVMVVASRGSRRAPQENLSYSPSVVLLDAFILVLYGVVSSSGTISWSAENSDDSLDLVEKSAMEVILDNSGPNGNIWNKLWLDGTSGIDEQLLGSDIYRVERIPLAAELSI